MDDCWLFARYIDRDGYGRIRIGHDGKITFSAHRVMYENFVGPIKPGNVIDHLCRVRRCVNPAHLEQVTNKENLARGISWNREKTHCKYSHEFTLENTIIRDGKRRCRECERMRNKARDRRVCARQS